MKKTFLLIIMLILSPAIILSCKLAEKESPVRVVLASSQFNHFEVIEDDVIFYCTICIENTSNTTYDIQIYGVFDFDVKGGLIKDSRMLGHTMSNPTDTIFHVIPGEQTYQVVFSGEYAGRPVKHDRLLPELEIVFIDEA